MLCQRAMVGDTCSLSSLRHPAARAGSPMTLSLHPGPVYILFYTPARGRYPFAPHLLNYEPHNEGMAHSEKSHSDYEPTMSLL
jgi:hypothetical protein